MNHRLLIAIATSSVFVAFAQTSPQERAEREVAAIKRLADLHYPAITRASNVPDDVVIGFLVDRDLRVIRHSSGFKAPSETLVSDELMRMFPDRKIRPEQGSGACFGTVKAKEPRYCVYWAEVDK